jgi:hypothetical protein
MSVVVPSDRFPRLDGFVRAEWAPIMFAPNPDTPERLVIGVVAVNTAGFHIAAADAGKRLGCLYGSAAATALLVQKASLTALAQQLAERGRAALSDPHVAFSGVSVGPLRAGEGRSLEELATDWLVSISSLHEGAKTRPSEVEEEVETAVAAIEAQADNDRLPVLVYRAVEETAPSLGDYFSADIRSRARKTGRPAPQKVFIGFAGSRVVANFATLRPTSRPRPAIDHIKRLMWDLARHRDTEVGRIYNQRAHEMIVFRRDENDPEMDERKAEGIQEMLEDLREQGAKDDILVQPRSSVGSIADHIRTVETVGSFA